MSQNSKYEREDFLQDPELDLERSGSLLNADDLRQAQDQRLLNNNLKAAFSEVQKAAADAEAKWDTASFDKRLKNLLNAEDAAARKSASRYVERGEQAGWLQLLLGNRLAQVGVAAAVITLIALPVVLNVGGQNDSETALSQDEVETWDGVTEELVGLEADEHALGNSDLDWVAAKTAGSTGKMGDAPPTEVALKGEAADDQTPAAPTAKPEEELAMKTEKSTRSMQDFQVGDEADAQPELQKKEVDAGIQSARNALTESRLHRELNKATTDTQKKAALQKLERHYKSTGESTKLRNVQRQLKAYK